MGERQIALEKECLRQSESCLYTSTSFHIWLRSARRWRRVFVTAPVVLGAVATWSLLSQQSDPLYIWVTGTCALLAGIFPALFVALDMNMSVDEISRLAAEFKSLQDRFRIAAHVRSKGQFEEFELHVEGLIERLDAARANSLTPPERFFKKAQKKIDGGDYDFGVDEQSR